MEIRHVFRVISALCAFSVSLADQSYRENLDVQYLSNGDIHLQFQHNMTISPCLHCNEQTPGGMFYDKFPESIGEFILTHNVAELHLHLTQGIWRTETLGYPRRPAAPPGAELWMWFNSDVMDPISEWAIAINSLAGLFCASLNFMTPAFTGTPINTFRPYGIVDSDSKRSRLLYSNLPGENVCTENLTPWKKLLPCSFNSGLANLLYPNQLFNARYVSLGVDVINECATDKCDQLKTVLTLSLSIVFDNIRIKGNTKAVSLMSLFHQPVGSMCPVAEDSTITLHQNPYYESELAVRDEKQENVISFRDGATTDVYIVKHATPGAGDKPQVPIMIQKYASASVGHGEDHIVSEITNNRSVATEVRYMDLVPWHFRILLHTLSIMTDSGRRVKPEFMFYTPSIDRTRPSTLELTLIIPAHSKLQISVKIIKVLLDWTEHPPDPHHGHFLGPSIVLFENHRIYSEPLIIQLLVPDFSMPYNVLCLSCTILTIGYSGAQTLVTRRYMFVEVVTMKQKVVNKLTALKIGVLSKFGF